ncbi:MAG: STAS domain-containing protein [Planctomycetales bacterium]|nr:STAS domain-containing protein [Planctomycetales bacterium]
MFLVDLVAYLVVALACGLLAQRLVPRRSVGGFLVLTAVALAGAMLGEFLARHVGAPELLPLTIGSRIPVLGAILGAGTVTIGAAWLQASGSGGGSSVSRGPVTSQWERFEAEARRRWARLTDNDWRLAANTVTGLADRIRERYGDARDTVARQLHLLMFRVREKTLPAPPAPGALPGSAVRRGRESEVASIGSPGPAMVHPEPLPQRASRAIDPVLLDLAPAAEAPPTRGPAFELSTEAIAPGVVRIQLRGALGAPSHHQLAEILATLIRGGTVRLVVDCSEVEAISSAGAAACVVAAGHAQARGGNIVLLRPSTPVRELLGVLGIDGVIPYAQDLEEALARLPVPLLPLAAGEGPGFP